MGACGAVAAVAGLAAGCGAGCSATRGCSAGVSRATSCAGRSTGGCGAATCFCNGVLAVGAWVSSGLMTGADGAAWRWSGWWALRRDGGWRRRGARCRRGGTLGRRCCWQQSVERFGNGGRCGSGRRGCSGRCGCSDRRGRDGRCRRWRRFDGRRGRLLRRHVDRREFHIHRLGGDRYFRHHGRGAWRLGARQWSRRLQSPQLVDDDLGRRERRRRLGSGGLR